MSARWEAATPHRCPCTTYFFFVFFAFFFAIRAVTSFRATMIGQSRARFLAPLLLLLRGLLLHRDWSPPSGYSGQ